MIEEKNLAIEARGRQRISPSDSVTVGEMSAMKGDTNVFKKKFRERRLALLLHVTGNSRMNIN